MPPKLPKLNLTTYAKYVANLVNVNMWLYTCNSAVYWRRAVVASVVRRMNEVTLRRARLVLGWVTVFGRVYHHVMSPAN